MKMISSFLGNLLIAQKHSLSIVKSRVCMVLSQYKCARSASWAFKAVRCSTKVALGCRNCVYRDLNLAKISSFHKYRAGNPKLRSCDSKKFRQHSLYVKSHVASSPRMFYINTSRDVEAVIFQQLPLPLPLTENEKTTVDNLFLTFVGL